MLFRWDYNDVHGTSQHTLFRASPIGLYHHQQSLGTLHSAYISTTLLQKNNINGLSVCVCVCARALAVGSEGWLLRYALHVSSGTVCQTIDKITFVHFNLNHAFHTHLKSCMKCRREQRKKMLKTFGIWNYFIHMTHSETPIYLEKCINKFVMFWMWFAHTKLCHMVELLEVEHKKTNNLIVLF